MKIISILSTLAVLTATSMASAATITCKAKVTSPAAQDWTINVSYDSNQIRKELDCESCKGVSLKTKAQVSGTVKGANAGSFSFQANMTISVDGSQITQLQLQGPSRPFPVGLIMTKLDQSLSTLGGKPRGKKLSVQNAKCSPARI